MSVFLSQLSQNLQAHCKTVTDAKTYRSEELGKIGISEIEDDIRSGFQFVQESLTGDKERQYKVIELCRTLSTLIQSFQEFKAERRIVEYTKLSFGGKIKRFFLEHLPRIFGGGYTYLQSDKPLDLLESKNKVNNAIKNLYLSAAPIGMIPTGTLTQNVCGVSVKNGDVKIWVKKAGDEGVIDYSAVISEDGIEIVGTPYPSWDEAVKKVQEIAQLKNITEVNEIQKKAREALAQYSVTTERALTGEEWYVKADGKNYRLYTSNENVLFSVTADGRFKKGDDVPVDTLKELFNGLNYQECLASKYRGERANTRHQIVAKGVSAGYVKDSLMSAGHGISITGVLKDGSFFVATSDVKGRFVSVKGGKVEQAQEYTIQEDGTLNPQELSAKLADSKVGNVDALWQIVEKAKLDALIASKFEGEGYRFCPAKPKGRLEAAMDLVLKWEESSYFLVIDTREGALSLPISAKGGMLAVTVPVGKGQSNLTDRTVEGLHEKIKAVVREKERLEIGAASIKERKELIESCIKNYGAQIEQKHLEEICGMLKKEGVHQPWYAVRQGNTIFIRFVGDFKNKSQLVPVKQDGKWGFRVGEKVYKSFKEAVCSQDLRPQDSIGDLLEREKRYKDLVSKLTGNKRGLFKWTKDHDFFMGKISSDVEKKDLEGKVMSQAGKAKKTVAVVYEKAENKQYFLIVGSPTGSMKTIPIKVQTTPEPCLVCEERRGVTLASIMPEEVVSMSGARLFEARARAVDEFFSHGGISFFTDFTSFLQAEEAAKRFQDKIPDGRPLTVVFRDMEQRDMEQNICIYSLTKEGVAEKSYIERDGVAINLYGDKEKENYKNTFETFASFCIRNKLPAISLAELNTVTQPRSPSTFSVADFVVNGRNFFMKVDSVDEITNKVRGIAAKVPEGKCVISVFEHGGEYFLCSLAAGQTEPNSRKFLKEPDGSISLLLAGGKGKEGYKSFEELCAKLGAMTYEEVTR